MSGLAGCGAVGSARGSGLRGRRFKSDHPDHETFDAQNRPYWGLFWYDIEVDFVHGTSRQPEFTPPLAGGSPVKDREAPLFNY